MFDCVGRWIARLLTSAGSDVYGAAPRSPRWPAARRKHLQTSPRCEACERDTSIEVHHVIPYHIAPDLELAPGNLMTLCQDCHFIFGHYSDWRSHNVTVRVDAAAWIERVRCRP